MCAPKVALVTLNELVMPFIEKSIALHKWQDRVTGVYLLDGHVAEPELDANFGTPGPYIDLLTRGIRKAIEGGAQVVIPAEGVLGVMAAENGLREVAGVPVIDAIGAPILFAELAVALKRRLGLAQSRAAYPSPSAEARAILAAL